VQVRNARRAHAANGNVQDVEDMAPKETSADKFERALNELLEDRRKKNDPTTHSAAAEAWPAPQRKFSLSPLRRSIKAALHPPLSDLLAKGREMGE
jgi:hypothetical protein